MNKEHQNEVIQKWGQTKAYKEYVGKTENYSNNKWESINTGLNNILEEFSNCLKNNEDVCSSKVQSMVIKLKDYITNNYYNCTNEILYNLGQMYISDLRFMNNIDKYGEGTAQYISKAIEYYCSNK